MTAEARMTEEKVRWKKNIKKGNEVVEVERSERKENSQKREKREKESSVRRDGWN